MQFPNSVMAILRPLGECLDLTFKRAELCLRWIERLWIGGRVNERGRA